MRGRYAMSCGGPWLWGKSPRELGEAFLENCTRHSASMSGWIPPAWWAARALDFDALPQPARAAGSLFAAAGGAGLTLAFNPLRPSPSGGRGGAAVDQNQAIRTQDRCLAKKPIARAQIQTTLRNRCA